MSTFNGFITEIPGISVDRFVAENRTKSSVFFLSHCHTDHMQGLHDPEPLPGPIYTSAISAVFLKHRYPQLTDCIRTLDLGSTTPIDLPTGSDLTVTTLPAGHCPGSVMFLFETDRKILYTGDFRLSPKDLRALLPLKSITLDVLYLDTTFFSRTYTHFPSQSQSLAKITQLTKEWLDRDPRNVVSFKLPALYGSEFLFIELSRALQQRIHVNAAEATQYRYLASLDDAVTSGESRIHACLKTSNANYRHLPCDPDLDSRFVRVLRPSAMRWRGLKQADSFHRKLGSNGEEFGVCYSNHASCAELEDFLRYLKPKKVLFNVIPSDKSFDEMKNLLGEICPPEEGEHSEDADGCEEFSFAGIQYRQGPEKGRSASSGEDSEEETVICPLPKRARS